MEIFRRAQTSSGRKPEDGGGNSYTTKKRFRVEKYGGIREVGSVLFFVVMATDGRVLEKTGEPNLFRLRIFLVCMCIVFVGVLMVLDEINVEGNLTMFEINVEGSLDLRMRIICLSSSHVLIGSMEWEIEFWSL